MGSELLGCHKSLIQKPDQMHGSWQASLLVANGDSQMGATVTTGKLAAAFQAPSGQNIYILFEETYEKNCTPHTPHWSCILFGNLSAAVERIFGHASGCEGGMLQGRGGSITPEGYIRGWLKELASPVAFPKETVALKIGEKVCTTLFLKRLGRRSANAWQ